MAASAVTSRRIVLAPDANAEAALEAVLGQCLGHFTANAACACEGSDPEGVHQMRIGARRARAALAVFQPLLPDRSARVLRSELRWLGRELGPARDLDVFTREVLPPIERSAGDDPAFKRLVEEAGSLRADCYAVVREVLSSPRYARLVLELGAWLHGRGWRNQPVSEASARLFAPARGFASELLTRRERRVRRFEKRVGESDEARHALRLELKKLRYAAEFFRDLFPERRPKRSLRRIARVQSALGRMNDVVTAHGILETLLARLGEERAPAHDRAAGFIEGWTTRLAAGDREDFEDASKRLRRTTPYWRD
jgi:CHAD domain-containing protein